MKHYVNYLILRLFTLPFSLLPYRVLHEVGRPLGLLAYALMTRFRKRALSNIALAGIAQDNASIRRIAKAAFQNLVITLLEYPKFARAKRIAGVAYCTNPDQAAALLKEGKGVIFFCGHQANWEVLFLEGTSRMPGVAIGRPVKNPYLYRWVVAIREQFGGRIVPPKNAIREGLRGLRRGAFLGIVGDQGMPDSGYCSPFFGRNAWTSPMPAILAYKTGAALIVATTVREKGGYRITYSPPLWPDKSAPMDREVDRLMHAMLALLEESIRAHPGQWLWQHNRWKQQTLKRVKKRFRLDALCVLLPQERNAFAEIAPHLSTLREIYPLESLTLLVPERERSFSLPGAEVICYNTPSEQLLDDYRFKLVFNFANNPKAKAHYKRRAAFEVLSLKELKQLAPIRHTLSETLLGALTHAC